MTEEQKRPPAWGYKLVDGEVEARLFPDGKLSRGWKDTPAGMKNDDGS